MSTVEEEFKSGLTPRVLIIGVISMPIILATTILMIYYSGKPWTFSGFFLPPVYMLLLNEILGRTRRSWRLSAQELTILMIPFYIASGSFFLSTGTPNEGIPLHWNTLMPSAVYIAAAEPWKTDIGNIIPRFMIPTTETAVMQAWRGVLPGETIDWSAWFVPLTYWSIIWIICGGVLPLCWISLLRKPLIEVERLPYVMQIPLNALIVHFSDVEPATNKTRIFDMKSGWNKTFWGFMVIGLIIGFWPILGEIIPIIPIGAWWGSYNCDFTSFTAPAIPGALFFGIWEAQSSALFVVLPFDILTSALLGWIVMDVMYPYIGIQAGFLPYEPGVEVDPGTGWYYGFRPPLPYAVMAMSGMMLGIGVMTFVGAWSHIRKAFSTITGGEYPDQGINLRNISIAIVALNVVLIAIFLGSGIPTLPALMLLIVWQLWQISMIRYVGEFYMYHPVLHDVSWQWLWGAGLATNAWTDVIPTQSSSLFATMQMSQTLGNWDLRFESISAFFAGSLYKIGEATKTKARDIFIALVVFGILGYISNNIINTLMTVHAGGLSMFEPWEAYTTTGANVYESGFAPGYTMEMHIGATVAGFVFVLVLYLLRMRFAALAFVTNPVGLLGAFWLSEWIWINALIALIIKIVILRVGGVKMMEERLIPAVTGYLVGFGIPFLIGGLYTLFSLAWPSYIVHYVP